MNEGQTRLHCTGSALDHLTVITCTFKFFIRSNSIRSLLSSCHERTATCHRAWRPRTPTVLPVAVAFGSIVQLCVCRGPSSYLTILSPAARRCEIVSSGPGQKVKRAAIAVPGVSGCRKPEGEKGGTACKISCAQDGSCLHQSCLHQSKTKRNKKKQNRIELKDRRTRTAVLPIASPA